MVILVIGGAYQGKKEYVHNRLRRELSQNVPDAEIVVENAYHQKIREQMLEGRDPLEEAKALAADAAGEDCPEEGCQRERWPGAGCPEKEKILVVICDEVGYGVVPADAFERAWRETVGRVCCYFAGEAVQVVRVICGIGERIK